MPSTRRKRQTQIRASFPSQAFGRLSPPSLSLSLNPLSLQPLCEHVVRRNPCAGCAPPPVGHGGPRLALRLAQRRQARSGNDNKTITPPDRNRKPAPFLCSPPHLCAYVSASAASAVCALRTTQLEGRRAAVFKPVDATLVFSLFLFLSFSLADAVARRSLHRDWPKGFPLQSPSLQPLAMSGKGRLCISIFFSISPLLTLNHRRSSALPRREACAAQGVLPPRAAPGRL